MLKSGQLIFSTNIGNLFQLTVQDNRTDLNILDNRFLKELVKDSEKLSSIRYLIKSLKSLAEELKNQGTTITISYKGQTVITMGSDAKPKFSHWLTKTTAVEINNLKKLIPLGDFN